MSASYFVEIAYKEVLQPHSLNASYFVYSLARWYSRCIFAELLISQ